METLPAASQNQSLETKAHGITVAKILWHLNQVVAYPMTDHQIEDWSRSVLELKPDVDLAALRFLIDKFKTGERDYDYRKGIQNVFIGLRHIEKTDKGYALVKDPVAVYVPRTEGTNNQHILDKLYAPKANQ